MKKLALVIAVVFIAAFFVTPVTASDFSAGGQYRFEAVSVDNPRDTDTGVEKETYFDQRMRVAFSWKVNDNVSAQLRGDFAEFRWGDGYRPEAGGDTLMVDRAWVKINQGPLTLTVGQQGGDWGLGTLWSDQFQGIQADFAFNPVTLKLLYVKESEGGTDGNVLTDEGDNDDTDTYGASLLYACDAFSGGLSFATTKNGATNDTKTGYSLHVVAPLSDMFTLSGAGEIFSGDDGEGIDYAGTQLHAALDATFSDTIKGGVTVIWANDVDSNESQLTSIADDAVFKPLDYDGALAYNNGNFGGNTGIFDVSGAGYGVTAIVGDLQINVTEAVTLWAKLGYAEPNEDHNLNSKVYAVANIDYAWMPAVTLSGGVGYVAPDYDDTTNDDALIGATVQLSVSF
ncbi:hypothetical protein [Desulfobacula sp.]|uniref:hypothetical protein n=1 Tax=Desulfobacula sp. TaxID=2593537 RepID=UPI002610EA1B|nr:hypothetical protein [Desulfobacula sp.]